MDRRSEVSHLHKAEAEIASGRERIGRQEQLVARLKRDGHDSSTAESMLQTMRDSLNVMKVHRELILDQLAAMKMRAW
jgi:hypothetical protein